MSEAAHPVLPPEEVTPRFDTVAGTENLTVTSLGCARTPEGRILLATASFGAFVVQLWDLESGRHLRTLTGHDDAMLDVAWGRADDGRLLLATGSYDGTVRIWDPANGRQLRTLIAGEVAGDDREQTHVLAWAWAAAGRPLLATAGIAGIEAGTARIWDPATGTELACLPGTGSGWRSAAWIRDRAGNLLLLLANPDDAAVPVRVWRVESGGGGASGTAGAPN